MMGQLEIRRWMPDYGTAVRRARESRGLTQAELAKAIGMRPPNLCTIERSRWHRPQLRSLERIAVGLDYTLPELLGYLPAHTPEG